MDSNTNGSLVCLISNLLGPNLMQNHLLPNGARQISVQKLENCYYHARSPANVRPVAVGAFRTCQGLRYQTNRPAHGECGNSDLHEWALRHYMSGNEAEAAALLASQWAPVGLQSSDQLLQSINVNGEPETKSSTTMARGPINSEQRLQSRTNSREANYKHCKHCDIVRTNPSSGATEWSGTFSQNTTGRQAATNTDYLLGILENADGSKGPRPPASGSSSDSLDSVNYFAANRHDHADELRLAKRDVSLSEKYIELGLVLSQDIFDKRNTSTRLEVLHDAIQIVNCLDLYFRSANTRVSIVYLETWAHGDQIEISPNVRQTLQNFLDYTSRKLYRISLDAIHLLTGGHSMKFDSNKAGISIPGSICTSRAVSVSQESSVFEPFAAASTMVHMLGHNLGMEHDDDDDDDEYNDNESGRANSNNNGHHDNTGHDYGQDKVTRGPVSADTAWSTSRQESSSATELKSVGEIARAGLAPSSPLNPFVGPARRNQQAGSGEMHGDEHEDEIKSRSLSRLQVQPTIATSKPVEVLPGECRRGNCLMSGRFNHLEAPISFGYVTIIQQQANASNQDPPAGGQANQGSAGTLVLDANEQQLAGQRQPGAPAPELADDDDDADPFGPNELEPQQPELSGSGDEAADQRRQAKARSQQHLFRQAGLPFRFSRQSLAAYARLLRQNRAICLFNKPNQLEDFKNCGNGIVDEGEECDCGKLHECLDGDSCCDPRTCRFKADAQCTGGACCDRCHFRPRGFTCRRSRGECDLAEQCSGASGQCPPDVFKQNGWPCGGQGPDQQSGFCYLGACPRHDQQCADLWGSDARNADRHCYSSFNLNGTRRGNCGIISPSPAPDGAAHATGLMSQWMGHGAGPMAGTGAALATGASGSPPKFRRCEHQHMMCGTLQCQLGNMEPLGNSASGPHSTPTSATNSYEYSNRTMYAADGRAHNCKAVVGVAPSAATSAANSDKIASQSGPGAASGSSIGYVRDGSRCGPNRVCMNKTCQPLELAYRDSYVLCPRDEKGKFCSEHGVCSTANRCHCDPGWTGHDCSQSAPVEQVPTTSLPLLLHKLHPSVGAQTPSLASSTILLGGQGGSVPMQVPELADQLQPQVNELAPILPEPTMVTKPLLTEDISTLSTTTSTTTQAPGVAQASANNASSTSSTSNIQVQDKKKHDALSAATLVFILVSIVAAVFIGFALMANCYRRKGFLKPDKVLRHHQMNCKLDAIRSSFIARRLADAEVAAAFATNYSATGSSQSAAPLAALANPGDGPIVNLVSPFVSPMSTDQGTGDQLTGLDPAVIQQQHQLLGPSFLRPQEAPDSQPQYLPNHVGPTRSFFGPAYGSALVGQQVQASVHQPPSGSAYCDSDEHLHQVNKQHLQQSSHHQQQPQQFDSSSLFGLAGGDMESGDHIPLLVANDQAPLYQQQQNNHHHHRHQHHKCAKSRRPTINGAGPQSVRRPMHQSIPDPPAPMGSFVGPRTLPPAPAPLKQPLQQQHLGRHTRQLDPLEVGNLQMNRAISLGNVNGIGHRSLHLSSTQLNDAEPMADEVEMSSDWRATVQTRALATPSRALNLRPYGRPSVQPHTSQAATSRRGVAPVEMDSCSAPSSPEHHQHRDYWNQSGCPQFNGLARRSIATVPTRTAGAPDSGYHEEVLFGPMSQQPIERQLMKQQRSLDHQTSHMEEDEEVGDDDDGSLADERLINNGEMPLLPPPPPPPASSGRMLKSSGNNCELGDTEHEADNDDDDDDEDDDENGPNDGQQAIDRGGSRSQTTAISRNQATFVKRQNYQIPTCNQHDNLSLIAQLQQLEQVQTLHQKQLATTAAVAPEVGLHEFFSLPLSVQLSALLARSLSEQQQHHHPSGSQQMTPIDEYLNALNSTNVATSSRRSFKGSSGQLFKNQDHQQSQQQQTACSSRGGTMRKQQVKLQNLQSLITRLQKLHNQTILQQQLEELNGEYNAHDDDVDEDNENEHNLRRHNDGHLEFVSISGKIISAGASVDPSGISGSRHSTMGRSGGARSRSVSRAQQTNDDSAKTAQQIASRGRRTANNGRRIQVTSRQHSIIRDGTITPKMANQIGLNKNESVYSMSDSEDGGAYVARMMNSYNRTTSGASYKRKKLISSQADIMRMDPNTNLTGDEDNADIQVPRKQTDSTTPTVSTDISSHLDHPDHQQKQHPPPTPPPPLSQPETPPPGSDREGHSAT